MKSKDLILNLALLCTALPTLSQDFTKAKDMCGNYGFLQNTPQFAECVQREIHNQNDIFQKNSDNSNIEEQCNRLKRQNKSLATDCAIRNCVPMRYGRDKNNCHDECQKKELNLPRECV